MVNPGRTELFLVSTSSGPMGYSVQSGYLGCSARADYFERARASRHGQPSPLEPEELVNDKKGRPTPVENQRFVGSMFGELVQAYVSERPYALYSPVYWEGAPVDTSHAVSVSMGWSMYKKFTEKHRPTDFGQVIGCEVPIKISENVLGLEVTGNIDFVSTMPGEAKIWINDIKTTAQVDNKERPFALKYPLEHQCWLYALGYHIETGMEIAGIRHIVQTRKASDTYIVESEGLTPARMRWLKAYADEVLRQKANVRPQPAPHHCIKFYKPCLFLMDGICSKI